MACGSILSDYKSMEQLEKTFDFGKRSVYDSTNSLARLRSSRYKRVKQPVRYQTWNRPAPDLRMQLYHPQPLPRNSLQAIKPWNYKASFDDQEVRMKLHILLLHLQSYIILQGSDNQLQMFHELNLLTRTTPLKLKSAIWVRKTKLRIQLFYTDDSFRWVVTT